MTSYSYDNENSSGCLVVATTALVSAVSTSDGRPFDEERNAPDAVSMSSNQRRREAALSAVRARLAEKRDDERRPKTDPPPSDCAHASKWARGTGPKVIAGAGLLIHIGPRRSNYVKHGSQDAGADCRACTSPPLVTTCQRRKVLYALFRAFAGSRSRSSVHAFITVPAPNVFRKHRRADYAATLGTRLRGEHRCGTKRRQEIFHRTYGRSLPTRAACGFLGLVRETIMR
jgi:hypothetical protein